MLRHASHRAISSRILESRPITHGPVPSLFFLWAHPRRSYAGLPPYPKLDEVNAVLNRVPPLPHAIHTAPESDIKTVNITIPRIHAALADGDIQKAWSSWSLLARKKLLNLVSRPAHERHARLLAASCYRSAETWSDAESAAAEEMSLYAAVAGYPSGLTACMLSHIRQDDPEAVHRLYSRYLEMLEERESWIGAQSDGVMVVLADSLPLPASQEDEGLSDDGFDSDTEEADSLPTDLPLVFPDILLCSVAAYAMQDNFLGALKTLLKTGTRLGKHHISRFALRMAFNTNLRAQMVAYSHRLDLARMTARPVSMMNQLTNLTKDRSLKPLQTYYTHILAALTDPNPWLTTDPAKINDKTPVLLPELTWGLFLKGFLHCQNLELAERLWDDMTRLGLTPSVSTWTALLAGYGELRMGEQLLAAWKIMQEQGIKPNAQAYQALIEGLLLAKMPMEAIQHFHTFRSSLKSTNIQEPFVVLVHNATIHGLLLNDKRLEAYAILELMQKGQPRPDIATYNSFLRYYGDNGDLKGLASVLESIDEAKLYGDVFTFSTLLTSLLKVREDAPKIMFTLMRKQDVKPNIVMYSGIIDHLMRQRNTAAFKAAMEILRTIEQNKSGDIAPSSVTYTSVLIGVLHADWLDASAMEEWRSDITRRMQERKIMLNTAAYNILIEAALENPSAQGMHFALLYYKEMPKKMRTNDTWYVVLRGLAQRGEWAIADEVLMDMRRSGFIPHHSLARLVHGVKQRHLGIGERHSTNVI